MQNIYGNIIWSMRDEIYKIFFSI